MRANKSVSADIERGEEPIRLSRLPRQQFMPRGASGKPINVSSIFRWASCGARGVRLETLQTPGGLVTTRGAVLRFLHRLDGVRRGIHEVEPTRPHRRHREQLAVQQRLEQAGL